jgi:hypothetical protein
LILLDGSPTWIDVDSSSATSTTLIMTKRDCGFFLDFSRAIYVMGYENLFEDEWHRFHVRYPCKRSDH